MSKRCALFLILFLTASVAAFAQRGSGGGGGGGGEGGGGGGGGFGGGGGRAANPALNPHAKTPEEKTAALAVGELVKNTSTTGDQMDKAIADFTTKYPKSDYLFQIDRAGVQFYSQPSHVDVDKLVEYAGKALKIVSNDGYTLSTAGRAIVEFDKPTDPNLAANLKFADSCNKKALEFAKALPDQAPANAHSRGGASDASGANPNDADSAASKMREAKENLQWVAYISLARSASMQKNYPEALKDFEKAAPLSDFNPAETDVARAWVYLYTAQTQEAAQQWADANASLENAAKSAGTSQGISQAVAAEQAKVKAAGH